MWWSFLSSPEICSDRGKKDTMTLRLIQREKPSRVKIDGIEEAEKESQVDIYLETQQKEHILADTDLKYLLVSPSRE